MKLPNMVTIFRMLLAPLFIWLFTRHTASGDVGALVVACLCEATDLADGQIARRTGQTSDLGKFLDPLADAISRFTVFLCFLQAGYASIWAVAVIFWRDGLVSTLRIMGATRNVLISARWSGKIKAACQGTAIITILAFQVWPDLFGLGAANVPRLARTIMVIIAAITVLTLVDYVRGNKEVLASLDR